ncbi:MAG: Cd(II)/Pb(II)-responsive transcriptional regulator [Sulfuricella sp.]
MRIGELAKITGIEVETLRYYERVGLVQQPARQTNGYRSYGQDAVERANFIRHCRTLDMGLGDIKRLLDFTSKPDTDCSDVNRLLDEHLARVRAKLKSLRTLEKQLARLRTQCDTGHRAADCGILQELVAAAHGEACACHPSDGNASLSNRKEHE